MSSADDATTTPNKNKPMRLMNLFYAVQLVACMATHLHGQGTYPLQVGNVWQYQDRWDSTYRFTTRAVAETLMPNGNLYTMLVSNSELDTLFFRQGGAMVYNYTKFRLTDSNYWQGDELWYDYSKTSLDTVTVRYYRSVIGGHEYSDTVVVTVSGDEYTNVFGQTRRQWGFYEQSLQTSMYVVRNVTDGIGLTFYQYEPSVFSYDLKGAIIDGVKYGVITDVGTWDAPIPEAYTLYQNYPNPFNPTTTIRFSLPHDDHITLEVTNVLGRIVDVLIDARVEVGDHSVRFDGLNLPSGVYLYRLKTSTCVLNRRMILLK
jgi:hypothetical protein